MKRLSYLATPLAEHGEGHTTPERARLSSSWRCRLKVRMVCARSRACRPLSLAWMSMIASSSGKGASSGNGPGSGSPLTVYLSAKAPRNLLRSSSSCSLCLFKHFHAAM